MTQGISIPGGPQTAPILKRIEKLKRTTYNAATLNPRILPVMTAPPTITASSSRISGCDSYYALQDSGVIPALNPFDVCGGNPYVSTTSGQVTFPCVRDNASTGGNIDNTGRRAIAWRVRIKTDAPNVCWGLLGFSNYRFLIDDGTGNRYASKTVTAAPSSGGIQYLNLAFGSALPTGRTITIEGASSSAISHVYVNRLYSVWRPDQADRVKIGVIGDSITAATGATFAADGYATVMGDFLGANDTWCMGLGSTGYISAGPTWKYQDHITDWTAYTDWDLLVFSGGNNDNGQPSASITAAAQSVISATRAALPDVPIVVLGPNGTGETATLNTEAAIKAAVTAIGSQTIQFVPINRTSDGSYNNQTGAYGSEVFGTGNAGAPNGTGNADVYVSSDGTHPSDAGHLYKGMWRAARVRAAIHAMAPVTG